MKRLGWMSVLLILTACAAPKIEERGWVGGEMKEAVAAGGIFGPMAPTVTGKRVVGLPDGVDAERALLVTRLPEESPLRRAGLHAGDLVLALDDEPVVDPADFREAIEGRRPGDTAKLVVWRGGRTRDEVVTVGKETYRNEGVIRIGLWFSPEIDLWPFDDGISIFDLVAVRWSSRRPELHSVEREWLAGARPGEDVTPPAGSTFDVKALPFSVGTRKLILTQEP